MVLGDLRGTIVSVTPCRDYVYHIRWKTPLSHAYFTMHYAQDVAETRLSRLCANCDLPEANHAEGGKCLYTPTSWL